MEKIKMAKTSKKYHYYVLVFTSTGAVYVTKNDYAERVSHWDRTEKPLEFSSHDMANDICIGLSWNGYSCQVVASLYELDSQPYRYNQGTFEWKSIEEEN